MLVSQLPNAMVMMMHDMMSCMQMKQNKMEEHEGWILGYDTLSHPSPYKRLVAQPIYLLNTHLDISFVVQQLSEHMRNPTTIHHIVAIRVLRYLKKSPTQGLFFHSSSTLQLKTFSDSDWATCLDTRKSINGYCIYLGSSLISWKSMKQLIVSSYSTEA